MDIRDNEKHERIIDVYLTREQLDDIVERAIADRVGVPVATLRKHGRFKIEPNMYGSPECQSGFKASLRATIPIPEV